MWSIGIFLIHLVEYLVGRRDDMISVQCGQVLKDGKELDMHIRIAH
jgi:hypothetical protein